MAPGRRLTAMLRGAALIAALALAMAQSAEAQTAAPAADAPAGWSTDVEVKKTPAKPGATNTTVIERSDKTGAAAQGVKLVALLTDNGQQIDQGLIWRVFQHAAQPGAKSKLLLENREASPVLKLAPGDYTVNAAFGRANLTKKVTIKAGANATEQFILNAGGLRLSATLGGKPAAPGTVTYSVFSDDHDQFDGRTAIMAGAKPNLIVRLNAGIYRVVSIYGDANAKVESDVTVEAGKLTEANVAHAAGQVSFKLVMREGGEALPDTHWTISTKSGDLVKETVGALPTHALAPGDYSVAAKSAGHIFTRVFSVKDGDTLSVEVLMDKSAAGAQPVQAATPSPGEAGEVPAALAPNLEIKIP